MYSKIDKASDYLRQYLKFTPNVVIMLNTSLNNLRLDMPLCTEIPFKNIPGFIETNDESKESKLYYGVLENKYVLLVQGKPFYYEGLDNEDFALPYRVFANLGIKNIIFATSAGGINDNYNIGDIVLIKDHISLFAPSLLRGKNYSRLGPRLIDTSNIYNLYLRNLLLDSLNSKDTTKVKEGVFAYYQGPSLESPSDIKILKSFGADMTGMSIVPEAILCHQCGMNIIGIAQITNKASGLNSRPLSYREVVLNGRISEAKERSIIKNIVKILPKE